MFMYSTGLNKGPSFYEKNRRNAITTFKTRVKPLITPTVLYDIGKHKF